MENLKIVLFLSLFTIALHTFAADSQDSKEPQLSFNPRDDYTFGVGTMVGGPLGIIGLTADFNWYSLVNAGIGLGSGIHFDTYTAQAKYLVLDQPFTPYLGSGLAYWRSAASGEKIAQKSEQAIKLGMVKDDGTKLKNGIVILPLSIGAHYLSDSGLAIFAEFSFLLSLSNVKAVPYGGLGAGWYF